MKAITFYFRNMEPAQSLPRFLLPFLTFMVDLTFGKILYIWYESRRQITLASSRVKGFICTNAQVSALYKKSRAKLLEETCNYPDF